LDGSEIDGEDSGLTIPVLVTGHHFIECHSGEYEESFFSEMRIFAVFSVEMSLTV
jgi:hypothetical protein